MDLISTIASFGGLFLAGANVMVFCIVKFNDLKHQEDALKRIENKLGSIDTKLDSNAERISKIEGKCTANHGS